MKAATLQNFEWFEDVNGLERMDTLHRPFRLVNHHIPKKPFIFSETVLWESAELINNAYLTKSS